MTEDTQARNDGQGRRVTILSHQDDLDGVASAVVADRYLRGQGVVPNVCFVSYETIEVDVERLGASEDELWIMDLSLKDPGLIKHLRRFGPEKLFIFDHHSSSVQAMASWQPFATILFDDSGNRCATDLVYGFVRETLGWDDLGALGPMVDAAHSRDLWIRDVQAGDDLTVMICQKDAHWMFGLLQGDPTLASPANYTAGMYEAMQEAETARQESIALANASEVTLKYRMHPITRELFDPPVTLVCALSNGFSSDVAHALLDGNGHRWVALIDVDRLRLSFRTNDETIQATGVSAKELAESIPGGGGHPCAAGSALPPEILRGGPNALVEFLDQRVGAIWQSNHANPCREIEVREPTRRSFAVSTATPV